MKKIVLLLFILTAGLVKEAQAQLDKYYFFYVGRNFIIDSKYKDAIDMLNVLLRVDDTAYEGYFLRGVAKYNLEDLLGAEQDFSRAIDANPVYTISYFYRAITRSRLGNYDDALHDFQEAIELRPDLPGPYFNRGITYLLSQQFEKAVDDFSTFIRYESKVADARINRGVCYLNLKDTARAYEDYEAAIRINRESPNGYARRGELYMAQHHYDKALQDFNQAIACDSTYLPAYFNRAVLYANTLKPVLAIADFGTVIRYDSTSSSTYFNRAILRSQIGDYNKAMEDYNHAITYSPNNVLLYYNRAALHTRLGDFPAAIQDYTTAINLYPDFANAYLGRSSLRYMTDDMKGSKSDKNIAERKIAEYRSKLNDSTFSIYADTSKRFNQLLSFESSVADQPAGSEHNNTMRGSNIALLPMFKFSLMEPDTVIAPNPNHYEVAEVADFMQKLKNPYIRLTNQSSDLPADTLVKWDRMLEDSIRRNPETWQMLFNRGISQSLIRQYTSSISSYTTAIEQDPSNPFLYINRSTTRSEMIDFISSIDNSFQTMIVDSDPAKRLTNTAPRTYNYDEALSDLYKAAKLLPDFAHIYYNQGNLLCLSGMIPEAIEKYTQAIELNPYFGEAYYNRGLLQVFLKDTKKGYLDISKAGELGIQDAYKVLKQYMPDK